MRRQPHIGQAYNWYLEQFDQQHWFCRRATLLFNSSSLLNAAQGRAGTAPIPPVFDSTAVYFAVDKYGKYVRKATADDGKGVNLGSDTALQTAVGTWFFTFSVDSVAVYTNLFAGSVAPDTHFLIRISNTGKLEIVQVNVAVKYTSSTAFVAGRVYNIALSIDASGNGVFVIDGVVDGTAVAIGTPAWTWGAVRFASGGFAAFDGANRMYLVGVSPIIYSRDRLISLTRDPWQMFYTQKAIPAAFGAAPAGTFMPFFSNQGGFIGVGVS